MRSTEGGWWGELLAGLESAPFGRNGISHHPIWGTRPSRRAPRPSPFAAPPLSLSFPSPLAAPSSSNSSSSLSTCATLIPLFSATPPSPLPHPRLPLSSPTGHPPGLPRLTTHPSRPLRCPSSRPSLRLTSTSSRPGRRRARPTLVVAAQFPTPSATTCSARLGRSTASATVCGRQGPKRGAPLEPCLLVARSGPSPLTVASVLIILPHTPLDIQPANPAPDARAR